jgi:hypothetical protein
VTPHRAAPHLPRAIVARSRALRRDMTQAERALWTGLRAALPDAHFRSQVPLGPYYADFASHRFRGASGLVGAAVTVQIAASLPALVPIGGCAA